METYVYCDGGSRNNQDPTKREGYGSFYVSKRPYPEHEAGRVAAQHLGFGKVTNNQAEYRTLQAALNYCINEFLARPTIYTDSELIVSQLNGTYKTKDPGLKLLRDQAAKDIALIGATVQKIDREIIVKVLGH